MKFTHLVNALVIALSYQNNHINGQVTHLENYLKEYRFLRKAVFNFVGRTDGDWSYMWNLLRGKVQKPFPTNQQFFCDENGPGSRSDSVPNSVHRLRPGDIDIIGAMGDSLTAGNGALATNILQVVIENKGVSWSIGGQSTCHKYLTLPNIIKVFNPNPNMVFHCRIVIQQIEDQEIGGMSRDMPHEAKVLIKRMISDPRVNVQEHWKLITLFVGANDFCLNLCHDANPEKLINRHKRDLITALRILRDSLPRTMVNLVTPPTMKIIKELRGKPLECEAIHHVECPCFFGYAYQKNLRRYYDIIERWKEIPLIVSNMIEFNNREDFTVTNQPFLANVTFPELSNGNHDFSYFSLDCFHLSQKGYAIAANASWNNMMEPEGRKSTDWKKEFTEVICPTDERPYIATKKNS